MSWYALDDPNDPQLDDLARQFQLHPLHIEDCRSNNERLKAEGTDEYLFLILKYIQAVEDGDLSFGNVFLFVGRDYLITVRDPTQSAANLYHTDMWPETYVIDRQGIIRRKFVGPQEWTSPEIVSYLESL